MQAAFDYAVEYVHDRKQFGQPVGTFQLMQGKGFPFLAELHTYQYDLYSQDRWYVQHSV